MKRLQIFRNYLGLVSAGLLLSITMNARALPVLQLDIIGGTYDTSTETIISTDQSLTVVAYGLKDGNSGNSADQGKTADTTTTYYISAALTPQQNQQDPAPDNGSFVFNGNTYNTSDMIYGTAPLDSALQGWDAGDLQKHGIFPTYFMQFAFNFSGDMTRDFVNTADTPGTNPATDPGSTLYYMPFNVDISNLAEGYGLHFDLYSEVILDCKKNQTCSTDVDMGEFAPFSHDAETRVPEPAPLALLSIGLLGLIVISRRQRCRI